MKEKTSRGGALGHAARRLPSWTPAVLVGLIAGAAVCFLLLLLMAAVMMSRDLSQSVIHPMVTVAGGVGAFVAGWVAAKKQGKQGMVIGAGCGGLMFLILLIAGLSTGGGLSSLTAVKLAVLVMLAALGGVVGVNRGKKRKMRMK